ncbi:cell division transport system permease protein [Garciella nitratireducens DSM 15102]|uniref:Cell division protein FtsX n=1 Tax=Garciella nitratireducens DSM 15102 TaxID=1121911 RepID=A0A1T4NQM4_9FIRM|nr:cell division transport system permease protein [Garciella nitratireducens]SJZ81435.1 cell division transport system permease protein [Garciella nitratireducens DSM 15102]
MTKKKGDIALKIRTFQNFIRDAIHNIWRNSWMSVASIASVVAVLIILGFVLIFMGNIQNAASAVEDTIELKAFLDVNISKEKVKEIEKQLNSYDKIQDITLETKEEALKNFSQQLGHRQDLLEGLEENNPLQNAYIISLKDPNQAEEVAKYIKKIDGIEEVKYGEEVVDKLLQSTQFIKAATFVLTVILAGVSIFVISNTIKITVFSRRREINIMKYVGATNWYIRWPFIIEGGILGVIGALFSILILAYGYYYVIGAIQNTSFSLVMSALVPAGEMMGTVTLLFLNFGLLIGIFGSILSIRKFLRV